MSDNVSKTTEHEGEAKHTGSRRAMLNGAAMLGASLVGNALLSRKVSAATKAPQVPKNDITRGWAKNYDHSVERMPTGAATIGSTYSNDLEILMFALTLEQLQLSFYTQVADADTDAQYLHGRLHEMVPAVRDDELNHVEAIAELVQAFGGTPAAAPEFQFPAEAFISPVIFSRFAYTLEEIAIGAYLDGIGEFRNSGVREAIASIYGNETRHAALWRLLGGHEFAPRFYEGPLRNWQVRGLVAEYMRPAGVVTAAPPTAPAPGEAIPPAAPAADTTGTAAAPAAPAATAAAAAPAATQ